MQIGLVFFKINFLSEGIRNVKCSLFANLSRDIISLNRFNRLIQDNLERCRIDFVFLSPFHVNLASADAARPRTSLLVHRHMHRHISIAPYLKWMVGWWVGG
mgnify:FL=1